MQAGMLICLCPSLRSDMYPFCPALCSPNITQSCRRQRRTASMFIDRYTDITTFREACLTLLNEDVFHVHAGVLQLELGHARSNFIVMGFVRQGVINSRPASCVLFENHPRHSVSWWIFGSGRRHAASSRHYACGCTPSARHVAQSHLRHTSHFLLAKPLCLVLHHRQLQIRNVLRLVNVPGACMQHFHLLFFHQHVASASRRNRPAPTLALENLGDRVSRELREPAQISQDPALALVDARRLVAAARLVKVMTVVSAWKEVRDFAVQAVCTTRACQAQASASAHVTANNRPP